MSKTKAEDKIASIRKEIAILVNEQGVDINEARKQMNDKYGKGWRERGLVSNSEDQWDSAPMVGKELDLLIECISMNSPSKPSLPNRK